MQKCASMHVISKQVCKKVSMYASMQAFKHIGMQVYVWKYVSMEITGMEKLLGQVKMRTDMKLFKMEGWLLSDMCRCINIWVSSAVSHFLAADAKLLKLV